MLFLSRKTDHFPPVTHISDNIGAGDQLTEGEVNEIMSHVGGEGENSDEVSIPKVQEVLLAELTAKKD
jgi:hypothetical protein